MADPTNIISFRRPEAAASIPVAEPLEQQPGSSFIPVTPIEGTPPQKNVSPEDVSLAKLRDILGSASQQNSLSSQIDQMNGALKKSPTANTSIFEEKAA